MGAADWAGRLDAAARPVPGMGVDARAAHMPTRPAVGLTCVAAPVPFVPANAVTRNPLVVQFWLLGLDAARGDLCARGFDRRVAPIGSSEYVLGDLTLHSTGLRWRRPGGTLHYWRPSETFWLCPDSDAAVTAGSTSRPPGARTLHRREGLEQVEAVFLEHEAWLARRHGPTYRAGLLARGLPPRVRRLVPAWEAWIARRVALVVPVASTPRADSPSAG